MADDCVFCRIARGEIPSTKVYEDGQFLAFKDIHPAAPVHLLVIPKKHIERVSEATPGDAEMLGGLLLAAGTVARREKLDHFRLIINDGAGAGQTVFHLHMHILGGVGLGEKLL
jgi:histidine triad (HIT) family protein